MGAAVTTKLTNKAQTRLKNALPRRHPICYDVGMRFGWSFVLLLVLGCTSPTLPLPPPEAPTESAGGNAQTIILNGVGATPGALVVIQNQNTNYPQPDAAATVKGDGTWTVSLNAVKNDTLVIFEIVGGEQTQSIDYTVLIN